MVRVVDYRYITRSWASLRRFAGYAIEAALDAVKRGIIDVAPYFAKTLYFLPFTSRSLEKVLLYSLVKASRGFVMNNPSYYEIEVNEVQGFEQDEIDKVKEAFESMCDLGLAELISPTRIKLKHRVITDVVRHIAPYISEDIKLKDTDIGVYTYPYRVISGIGSLYVMCKSGRLPSSLTIMLGLTSPIAYVKKDGTIERKSTISTDEWIYVRNQIASLKQLRDKFDVEYFKAIGVLYENRIIVNSYPLELSSTFIDCVIKPAYHRYYTLIRQRRTRGRYLGESLIKYMAS